MLVIGIYALQKAWIVFPAEIYLYTTDSGVSLIAYLTDIGAFPRSVNDQGFY
jgi:hypothetical protein